MAWTPMSPVERASIEAQVILKAAVELAVAEIGNEPDGVAVTMAIENARALAKELPNLKDSLVNVEGGPVVAVAPGQSVSASAVPELTAVVTAAFPGAAQANAPAYSGSATSKYVADEEYGQVLAIWQAEKNAGVVFAGKDSMFLCNQAIRQLFGSGTRQFPADYWAEALQSKDIPVTKNGKCGLGDFKIKKGVSVNADGTPVLNQGEGNHPLASKSGYFAALVKNTSFNWGDRPDPVDPQGWLAKASA
jgi:hypothetical protein